MREDGFAARLLFNGTSNLLVGFFHPFGARFNFGLSRPVGCMHVYTYENTGARPVKTNSETFKGYPGKVSLFWNETVPRISIKIIRTRTSHVVMERTPRNGTRSNSWQDKKIPRRCQSGSEFCLRDHFLFFIFFPPSGEVVERGITTSPPLNGNIMYPRYFTLLSGII